MIAKEAETAPVNPELEALQAIEAKITEFQSERDSVREKIRSGMVQAVVVFIDMVGSTEFKQKHAGQPWVWILRVQQFTQVIAQYVEKVHGEVAKYIGDEVMAVFHGKEAIDNAMALVGRRGKIEESLRTVTGFETRIKIALDKGSVYLLKFEGHNVLDPQGSAVDRCARIAKHAEAGIVLASEDVVGAATDHQWSLAGQVPAKGLGTISIYQLGKATINIKETKEVIKADYEELVERDAKKSGHIAEFEQRVKDLEDKNRALQGELRNGGATPSAANSVEDESEDEERYEELLAAAKRALRPLPSVVTEALFYSYIGERYHPESFEDGKWAEIQSACQYKFLVDRDGDFQPNDDNRRVRAASDALGALSAFLDGEASSIFNDKFSATHDYDADFTNREFWERQLDL